MSLASRIETMLSRVRDVSKAMVDITQTPIKLDIESFASQRTSDPRDKNYYLDIKFLEAGRTFLRITVTHPDSIHIPTGCFIVFQDVILQLDKGPRSLYFHTKRDNGDNLFYAGSFENFYEKADSILANELRIHLNLFRVFFQKLVGIVSAQQGSFVGLMEIIEALTEIEKS